MSIRTHLRLMLAGAFAGAVGLPAIVLWGIANDWVSDSWVGSLCVVAAMIVGLNAPRSLFRRWVTARCDDAACDGRALPHGNDPIVYECTRCGRTHRTRVSEAGSANSHDPPTDF